jgi:hypothetical protein
LSPDRRGARRSQKQDSLIESWLPALPVQRQAGRAQDFRIILGGLGNAVLPVMENIDVR